MTTLTTYLTDTEIFLCAYVYIEHMSRIFKCKKKRINEANLVINPIGNFRLTLLKLFLFILTDN